MPSYVTGSAGRLSWRLRSPANLDPPDAPDAPDAPELAKRAELMAGLAILALLAELLFAQLTLVLAICFLITGRLSRWRPLWLALPAAVGLAWILAAGPRPALAGFTAGGGKVLAALARHSPLHARLAYLRGIPGSWRQWLPRQLPVALIAAPAQAGLLALAGLTARPSSYRPGLLIAARNRYLTSTLRRGELATSDGCCVGIDPRAGTRATISWSEAGAGMLCTSRDADAATLTGLDLAIAAIQHRKSVIIIDLAPSGAEPAVEPGTGQGDPIGAACAAAAAPLHRFGGQSARYDPLSCASPARAVSLTMAMIDWDGIARADQLFCANYLNAALALITTRKAAPAPSDPAILGELVSLLRPGALAARLAELRERSAAADSLASRVTEITSAAAGHHLVLARMTAQLAELNGTAAGQLLRPSSPSGQQAGISLRRAIASREVVHFSLGGSRYASSAAMIARLAVADLIDNLAQRSDLGCAADCAVWINGCDRIDHRQLRALVALGERAGTAVILGTTAGPAAVRLATEVNIVAIRGRCPPELASRHLGVQDHQNAYSERDVTMPGSPGIAGEPPRAADDDLAVLARLQVAGDRDALSVCVRRPERRLIAGCRVVR